MQFQTDWIELDSSLQKCKFIITETFKILKSILPVKRFRIPLIFFQFVMNFKQFKYNE